MDCKYTYKNKTYTKNEILQVLLREKKVNSIIPNQVIAGFVHNNSIYLNMDKMNLDTSLHEFGHLWLSWAKSNLAEAYARGLELAKSSEADPYRQYVMDTQPDLAVDSNEFLEEVLAQAIGDNGARLVEENSTKTKSWLQDLWDAIGKMLGLSQFTADQIMNMTLNDYANAVAVDLLSGRELTGPVDASQEVQKSVLKDYRDNTRFKFSDLIYPDVVFKDITTEKEAKVATDFYKKIINKFNKEFDRELKITASESNNDFNVSVQYETGLTPKYFAYPTATMGEHKIVDFIDKNVPLTSLRHELLHEMLVKHITDKFERINNLDNSAEAETIEEVQRNRAYNYTLEDVFFERVVESIERNPDNVDTFEMSTFGTDVINRIKKELGNKEATKENVLKELDILLEDSNPWMVNTLKDIFENKINYDVQDLSELSAQVGNLFKQRYDISSNIFSKELQRKIFDFTQFFNEEYTGVLTRMKKIEKRNKLTRIAPGNRLFNTPLAEATTIANKYNAENGLAPMVDNTITKIDKTFSTRISNAYDDMEITPFEQETQEAYKALVEETLAQHRAILAEGYNVEINDSEPYENAQEMIDDLRENKRMKIFSTESGFGDEPITEEQRNENPLLQKTEFKDVNNVTLLANDVFRFVHDFFGHAKLGNGFGPVGEENAWRVHVQMYSPTARKAITTETRGQNSWVNFSGVNEEAFKVRDEARKLRKEGKIDEAKILSEKVYNMMKFADQKVGILPEWVYEIPQESLDDTTIIPECV